ncbi:serine/threonine-protein kinase [Actinokineospora sp. HUAS TT18]|uniref:serine/threonine-protein kinase n=1 Tax=Actinokineospora sp. HUAS TT18 TaxID=3447451 RepID=UPI003F52260B
MTETASAGVLASRYRLDDLIGAGGMAEVYRACDKRLGRAVAIKILRDTADETDRRFHNEVEALACLVHPGLVRVYDAGTDGAHSFMVLQLVEGSTLRDRILDGPLPIGEVRALGACLADTLAYVHANGVVHRDIKPSNILLDADHAPYLTDFGLAHVPSATRITNTGELVGTAAYLAPEQVRGEEIDFPVDIYALGLVLLECLTGQREYEGNQVESAVARLHRPPVIPDDLPADLARLLALMTDLVPYRRPSAEECARALRGGGTTTLRLPTQQITRRRRLGLGAAMVSALAVFTIAFSAQPTPTSAPPVEPTTAPTTTLAPPPTTATIADEQAATTAVPAPVQPAQKQPDQDRSDEGKADESKGKSGKGKSKP